MLEPGKILMTIYLMSLQITSLIDDSETKEELMNRALIDTDILSYYLKGDPAVRRNFEKYLDNYD